MLRAGLRLALILAALLTDGIARADRITAPAQA
jgi:hypothetical protein